VLESALARQAEEQSSPAEAARFIALRPFLSASPSPGEYERIAVELGLTRAQVAKATHMLARRFGELVRAEVAATLENPADTDAELRRLVEALA
jgi:RNA polymerase sigma-70 factor (ECF subfamily)